MAMKRLISLHGFLSLFTLVFSQNVLVYEEFMDDDFIITKSNPNQWVFIKQTTTATDLPENLFYDCGNQKGHRIFGGYQIFSGDKDTNICHGPSYQVQKTFNNFPPHFYIIVSVKVFKIDSWRNQKMKVDIDSTTYEIQTFQICDSVVDICGSKIMPQTLLKRQENPSYSDSILFFQKGLEHNSINVNLKFYADLDDCESQSWGIRELQIKAQVCHKFCSQCFGPGQDQCQDCYQGMTKTHSLCECLNFYLDIPNCYNQTCQKCVTKCPDGMYGDSNKVCQSCKSSCQTCSNKFECITCATGYFNPPSCLSCGSGCIDCSIDGKVCNLCDGTLGYILNNTTKKCVQCSTSNCSKCLNTNVCTECNVNFYLSASNTCEKCKNPNCTICTLNSSGNTCIKCNFGYYLYNGDCVENCPIGKYKYPTQNICVSQCPDGYYSSSYEQACKPCHKQCSSCNGPLQVNCLNCEELLYKYISDQGVRSCLQDCPSGFYKDEITKSCLRTKLSLYSSSCQQACPQFYYFDESQYACNKCQVGCEVCNISNSNLCYYCQQGYYMTSSNQCIQKCENKYFGDIFTRTCNSTSTSPTIKQGQFLNDKLSLYMNCHDTCFKCSDEMPCCEINDKTFSCNNLNFDKCPFGQKCINCHFTCDLCTTGKYNGCQTCKSNRVLTIENTCECQDGYVDEKNSDGCNQSSLLLSYKYIALGLNVFNLALSLLIALVNNKFVLLLNFLDLVQAISMLKYLNSYQGKQLSQIFDAYYVFNFQQLICTKIWWDENLVDQSLTKNRFHSMKKNNSFLHNACFILVLIAVTHILYGISKLLQNKTQSSNFCHKICKLFDFRLIWFVVYTTSQEGLIFVFLQMLGGSLYNLYNIASMICCSLYFLYLIIFTIFVMFNSYSTDTTQMETFIRHDDLNHSQISSRIWFMLLLLKKILVALFVVVLNYSAEAQTIGLFINSLFFTFLSSKYNPYKRRYLRILSNFSVNFLIANFSLFMFLHKKDFINIFFNYPYQDYILTMTYITIGHYVVLSQNDSPKVDQMQMCIGILFICILIYSVFLIGNIVFEIRLFRKNIRNLIYKVPQEQIQEDNDNNSFMVDQRNSSFVQENKQIVFNRYELSDSIN